MSQCGPCLDCVLHGSTLTRLTVGVLHAFEGHLYVIG